MRVKLYRQVGKHIRYYIIELYRSLFGEYVVERIYGNVVNRAPTGVKRDVFHNFLTAQEFFTQILQCKKRRGYKAEIGSTPIECL